MKTAMILAAGRGERLRPLTDNRPKALCTVQGIPLIEYHVIHLARAGIRHIVINHAYLGGQIRQHLKNGARFGVNIEYAPEPPGGLETGGGVVNALPLLGDEPFLTVNADILTDYDFSTLALPTHRQAHLVLTPKPEYSQTGDFGLSEDGLLLNESKPYTFTGIACFRPELFQTQRWGRFSLTPLLRQLANQQQASAEVFFGRWFDIGSLARLENASQAAGAALAEASGR